MSRARIVATVAVLAVAGGIVAVLAGGGGEPVTEAERAPPPGFPAKAEECGKCHTAIYREWQAGWHATAYTDAFVREQTDQWRKTECLPCHVPQPVHETGIGQRTLPRTTRRPDGIDCISCHYKTAAGRGAVAAPHEDVPAPSAGPAPCNPVYTPEHATVEQCAGCHNQHWTVDEWRASPYSQGDKPVTCLDCHMPVVEEPVVDGGPPRRRRHHTWPGGHSPAQLKKAVTFEARIEGHELVVSTTNSGAGHKSPADARHRSFNVLVWFYDEAGNRIEGPVEIAEYRLYYRQQFHDPESTQILPKATAVARRSIPERLARGKAVAKLFYCLTPIIADELRTNGSAAQSTLVAEQTVGIE